MSELEQFFAGLLWLFAWLKLFRFCYCIVFSYLCFGMFVCLFMFFVLSYGFIFNGAKVIVTRFTMSV